MIKNRTFLSAFEKVAALRTVHAAAQDLRLTQTAVTQRIKSLENELGVTLFIRSRRGMSLTEEGKLLLRYQSSLNELDAQFLAQIRGQGRSEIALTIVGPTSAISTRIASNCVGIYAQFPFLRVHLRSEDQHDRIDQIKMGRADLAIVPPDRVPNEMDSKRLKPDRYVLVASAQWRRRRLEDILANERIIDFGPEDGTTESYLKRFELPNAARPPLYVNENDALIQFFIAGIGFGTLTESVARPHLESGSLISLNHGRAVEDPLALAWYPRSNRSDYFQELVRTIK